MNKTNSNKAFSLVEIIVAIAIISIIFGISTIAYNSGQAHQQSKTIVDGIVSTLERAKSDAISGKNGTNAGVYFTSNSYTYFSGSSFNSSDPNNINNVVPSRFVISETIPNGNALIFARLSGFPVYVGNITITDSNDNSNTKTVSIGTAGDITVIQ